jgi:hypothetical protein
MVSQRRLREHLPVRPIWRCRVCAAPWPCQPARLALLTEYADDRVSLCLYLCASMHEAIDDLYPVNVQLDTGNLFERFLAWAPRQPRSPISGTTTPVDEAASSNP